MSALTDLRKKLVEKAGVFPWIFGVIWSKD